jgi:enoyl-CoA hydratase/carnithine racemase
MNEALITQEDSILRISMNRPAKKNAINNAMYDQMTDAVNNAQDNQSIRVIYFTGEEGNFTSGNDLGDFVGNPPNDPNNSPVARFLQAVAGNKKPMIAAVDGIAVGLGTTLLLHCDLAYASDRARFRLPFTQLGLCPEAASSLLFTQLAGYKNAAQYLLLGDFFDSAKAKEMGLLNDICAPETLQDTAWATAKKLSTLAPNAVQAGRKLIRQANLEPTQTRIVAELEQFIELLSGGEFKEAITAFQEKRPADFSKF